MPAASLYTACKAPTTRAAVSNDALCADGFSFHQSRSTTRIDKATYFAKVLEETPTGSQRHELEKIFRRGRSGFRHLQCVRKDGKSFRNTEFFVFAGDKVAASMSISARLIRMAHSRPGEIDMSLTLYFHPLSSFCWKALVALYENDTPFTPSWSISATAERAALLNCGRSASFRCWATRRGTRSLPELSIIIEYLGPHYPGRTRFIPAEPDSRAQTRLRDRFYDLYVHLPMQKIVGDRLRPAGNKDPHGVDGGEGAVAQILRHDRAADGRRRLGDGGRLQPCRLRRGAGAVLRQQVGPCSEATRTSAPISTG